MRRFTKLLLFWLFAAPLFYFLLLPFLMDKLHTKIRTDTFNNCLTQLRQSGLIDQLRIEQSQGYCHCISDTIRLTHADLLDLVQRKPPVQLNARMKTQVNTCHSMLGHDTIVIVPQAN